MRRDYFTLTVDDAVDSATDRPVLTVAYEGPTDQLESRLSKGDSILDDEEIDVAYRLQASLEADEPTGVVAIADRVTGEYAFELNAPADELLGFIDAARGYGDASDTVDRYRIVVETEDETLATYDKSTLLVYDADGNLLRGRSLIPSGVEI